MENPLSVGMIIPYINIYEMEKSKKNVPKHQPVIDYSSRLDMLFLFPVVVEFLWGSEVIKGLGGSRRLHWSPWCILFNEVKRSSKILDIPIGKRILKIFEASSLEQLYKWLRSRLSHFSRYVLRLSFHGHLLCHQVVLVTLKGSQIHLMLDSEGPRGSMIYCHPENCQPRCLWASGQRSSSQGMDIEPSAKSALFDKVLMFWSIEKKWDWSPRTNFHI